MNNQIRTHNNTTSLSREKPVIEYESSSESSEDEDIIDSRFKDTISDSDEEMFSEDGEEEEEGKEEDHHSSDDSIDGDNYMSEDIDEEYDSNKVSNNDMNDIETD